MRKRGRDRGDSGEISCPAVGVLTDISASPTSASSGALKRLPIKSRVWRLYPRRTGRHVRRQRAHRRMSRKATCRKIFYGFGEENDVRAVDVRSLGEATAPLSLSLVYGDDRFPLVRLVSPGRPHGQNSLAVRSRRA